MNFISESDLNDSLIDYNNDEFNAMNSEDDDEKLDENLDDQSSEYKVQKIKFNDHYFDIDNSSLKIKSVKDDEWEDVNTSPDSSDIKNYFDSINCNQVAIDIFFKEKNINIGSIEKFVGLGGKVFFLVNDNGKIHIINNEIAPIGFRVMKYENHLST